MTQYKSDPDSKPLSIAQMNKHFLFFKKYIFFKLSILYGGKI